MDEPAQEIREDASISTETTSLLGSSKPSNHHALAESPSESYTQIPRYFSQASEQNEERARLLDPDDPAVSPLNLKGVKLMRLGLSIMLAVTYIWTVLLFVNCFVSLPGIKLRTSGFLELEYVYPRLRDYYC